MFERTNRTVSPALALFLAAAAFQVGPVWAGQAQEPGEPVDRRLHRAGEAALDRASELIAQDKLVHARFELLRLLQHEEDQTLTADQRERAYGLLGRVKRGMEEMDSVSLSLAQADLASERGELLVAERHAAAVLESGRADAQQRLAAEGILESARERREELAPLAQELISQAVRDFEARRYGQSKAALGLLVRSGVELDPAQRDVVQVHQSRIVELERARGRAFEAPAAPGVFQPSVIRQEDPEQPAVEQPPEEPRAQPPEDPVDLERWMRINAQAVLAEADRAFEDANWARARSLYRQLQAEMAGYLEPAQREHVRDRLDRVSVELRQPRGDLGDEIQRRQIIRAEAEAEFNNLLQQARRALDAGDTGTARDRAAEARLRLGAARDVFSQQEFDSMQQRVADLLTRIERRQVELIERDRAERLKEMERLRREAELRDREDHDRRVHELIERARAHQAEHNYEAALQTVEQLLFIDPNNPVGLLLKPVYEDMMIFLRYQGAQRSKNFNLALQTVENQEAITPPRHIMNFAPDWRAISIRRGEPSAFADTPENRAVYADLRGQRVPEISLQEHDFAAVIEYVETMTRHSVDVDWRALSEIGVAQETPVTLTLRNVPMDRFLEVVMDKVSGGDLLGDRAGWEVRDGIIVVSSDRALRRHTHLHIYDVRDLLLDVPDYDEVPQIDLQQAMQQGRGGGGQSPFRQDQDVDLDRRTLEERTQDIIDIITEHVDFDGWIVNGGETGRIQQYGGSLIIVNTARNHTQIHGFLRQLREVRAMQINVESRFLLVNQDYFEQIGFDIDLYINANNNQVRTARAVNPTVQPSDFFDPRLRRTITSPETGPVVGPVDGVSQGVVNPRQWSPIGFQSGHMSLSQSLMGTEFAGDILNASPALGIAGQFLDDIQVDFLVQATQADRRSVTLTAPRLTFTNGQIANIYVATQSAFVSDLDPIVGDSAVGFDPTIDIVTEGVTMLVEGVISADRRYVTMNVDVGISRVDGFAEQGVTAVAGGQLVASADTQSFIQLPTVTVTRVRTTVTVPDQGTVLLGGQRLITEFEVETGVPVLSKMPILNRFFSNRIEAREEQTLLILIKPTVLIQTEEEERHFPGLQDAMGAGIGGW